MFVDGKNHNKETTMPDDLKQNIARMEAELAAMKETLSKRERNWPEEIERGMLFRHVDGDVFMTAQYNNSSEDMTLIKVSVGGTGNCWAYGELFHGDEHEFTYLGLAADHLRIV